MLILGKLVNQKFHDKVCATDANLISLVPRIEKDVNIAVLLMCKTNMLIRNFVRSAFKAH